MTYGVGNFKCDDTPGQEPQAPVGVSLGRRAQSEGDQLSLLLAAENLFRGRLLSLLAVQDLLETLGHKALSQFLDSTSSAIVRLCDSLVCPSRAGLIGLQEHLRPPDLLARPGELRDNISQNPAFLRRQPHDILLSHGTPPCCRKHPISRALHKSDFLAVTER